MRKHINFAIAATIVGLVMFFSAQASVVNTNVDLAWPKVELSSPMSNPYLPIRVLDPVY